MTVKDFYTLENGLRCVHIADRSAVEMAGVFVNAGSRNDPPHLPGTAHFVEHTIFKGTTRRSSWHVNNRMEAVGGELNAFTSKEETFVYTIGPRGCAARAIELLADLVGNATFPEREIEIERGVVVDEIDSYLDSPADAVYDDFEDLLFAGSALGHNILGSRESVGRITADDCRRFLNDNYTPENMVLFYTGAAPAARIRHLAERCFGALRRQAPAVRAATVPVAERFDCSRSIDAHQANTVTGVRCGGRNWDGRLALQLLTNILGGPGMNALLNLELREKRGLVYSVEATSTFFSDCGMFTVAYGCDPSNERRCRQIVRSVIESRLEPVMSPRRLAAAKKQLIGQTLLRNDYRDTFSFNMARNVFFKGRPADISEYTSRISELTADSLRPLIDDLLRPESFSTLTLV